MLKRYWDCDYYLYYGDWRNKKGSNHFDLNLKKRKIEKGDIATHIVKAYNMGELFMVSVSSSMGDEY